jgi:hypothetical protein
MGGRRPPYAVLVIGGNDNIVDFRFDFGVGSAIGLGCRASTSFISISVDPMNAVASGSISGRRIIRDHGYPWIVLRDLWRVFVLTWTIRL